MKYQWFLVVGLLLSLWACGSKTPTSGDNGSTGAASSSSAAAVSSSSAEEVEVPGLTAATMGDLFAISDLGTSKGRAVKLILGPESGIYTKLYFDPDNNSPAAQLIGVFNLSASGKVTFDQKECLTSDSLRTEICPTGYQEPALWFKLDADSTLLMGTDVENLQPAVSATVVQPPATTAMRKASDLVGAWQSDSISWEFYGDYSFVKISQVNDVQVFTQTGKYDIQRSQLMMINEINHGASIGYYPVELFSVLKTDDSLKFNSIFSSISMVLRSAGKLGTVLDATQLAGTWESEDDENAYELALNSNRTFAINIYIKGEINPGFSDTGSWSVAGNRLVLDFNDGETCKGNGHTGGVIIDGNLTCYTSIIGEAAVQSGVLTFTNDYWPSAWSKP